MRAWNMARPFGSAVDGSWGHTHAPGQTQVRQSNVVQINARKLIQGRSQALLHARDRAAGRDISACYGTGRPAP
jgi:hypothetical protein